MLLLVQGPSSASQFWAEWAKPVAEYLDGFAEAVQTLDPQQSLLMDSSLSTSHFYWSAGASPCRSRCLALASCLLSHVEGVGVPAVGTNRHQTATCTAMCRSCKQRHC
jgi:hypothetical protein